MPRQGTRAYDDCSEHACLAKRVDDTEAGFRKLTERTWQLWEGSKARWATQMRQGESLVGPAIVHGSNSSAKAIPPSLLDIVESTVRTPFTPDGIWLVRPDGYVALSAQSSNWEVVNAYLVTVVLINGWIYPEFHI